MELKKGDKLPACTYTPGGTVSLARARELVKDIEGIPDPQEWENGEGYLTSDGGPALVKLSDNSFQRAWGLR